MKEAGCRLLIVGYESGDEQILKNIKKGATIDMAQRFTENCHKLGLMIHGDFIVGLPGETRETLAQDHRFRQEPGCGNHSGFDRARVPGHRVLRLRERQPGEHQSWPTGGHQLPNVVYPGFERGELVEWVERFYGEYYFRPKAAWRVVSSAVRNNDIPRLYKEAREYLFVSKGRKKFVKEQKETSAALRGAEGGAS